MAGHGTIPPGVTGCTERPETTMACVQTAHCFASRATSLLNRLVIMSRTRFTDTPCSVARSLDQVGDWWTLLIVRNAFFGMTRFAEHQADLGISKAVLTDRLSKLVGNGILERERLHEPGARYAYTLTRKGRDLWTVLTALRLWADKWVYGPGNEPLLAQEPSTGRTVRKLVAADEHGEPIDLRSVQWAIGPTVSPGAPDDD